MRRDTRRIAFVVRRQLALASVALAIVLACVWAGTALFRVGIISAGAGTDVRFHEGVTEVRHTYAYNVAPPVPWAQWHRTAVRYGWVIPPPKPGWATPTFGFWGKLVRGRSNPDMTISPDEYWMLRVPFWAAMLPGTIIGTCWFAGWHHHRRQQARGFAVEPPRRGDAAASA